MSMQDLRGVGAAIPIPADGNHAVFVRVFYNDVIDATKEHFSGSIYRLFLGPDGDGDIAIYDEPIFPGSAYWAWDEEREN